MSQQVARGLIKSKSHVHELRNLEQSGAVQVSRSSPVKLLIAGKTPSKQLQTGVPTSLINMQALEADLRASCRPRDAIQTSFKGLTSKLLRDSVRTAGTAGWGRVQTSTERCP